MTISYLELKKESEQFLQFINALGFTAMLREDSFRDYNVKLLIEGLSVILYHKPSKKTFSIGTQEVKDAQKKEFVEELWYQYQHKDEAPVQGLCAYVDGSFYQQQVGWGVVIVNDNQVLESLSGKLICPRLAESHQIAGEIEGVLQALAYATENQYKQITIYYDYMGLQKWACYEWKANSYVAQQYLSRLKEFTVNITWKKVKAHTGNKYNEMADRLAKGIT